jgi:hypothetical protein
MSNSIKNRFANLEIPAPADEPTKIGLSAEQTAQLAKRTGLTTKATYTGVVNSGNKTLESHTYTNGYLIDLIEAESAGNKDLYQARRKTRLQLQQDGSIVETGTGAEMTHKALYRLAEFLKTPKGTIDYLSAPGLKDDFKPFLVEILNRELDERVRTNNDKDFLIRLNGAGQIRHFASEDYAIYDSIEMVRTISEFIPDARWTKIAYDGDNFRGTLIVPDQQVRADKAGSHVGVANANSEVGEYAAMSAPFLFLKACLNGMIFGKQTLDVVARKKHSKSQGFDTFREQLTLALMGNIEVGNYGVERMEVLEQIPVLNPAAVIAQLSKSFGIDKDASSDWLLAYGVESTYRGESASAVVNGLTRAAQRSDLQWELEQKASDMLTLDGNIETTGLNIKNLEKSWDSIIRAADRLSSTEIKKRIPILVTA